MNDDDYPWWKLAITWALLLNLILGFWSLVIRGFQRLFWGS